MYQKTHLKNNCRPKYTKNFQNWTVRKQPNLKTDISPVVQGPRLSPSNAMYVGSIPNKGTRIPYAIWHSKKEIPARLLNCSSPVSSIHGLLQARILQWVAMSSARASSRLRDWTRSPVLQGGFFTIWGTRKPNKKKSCFFNLKNDYNLHSLLLLSK